MAITCTGQQNYALSINCPGLAVSPATIPAGTVGTVYNQPLSASGGATPYLFGVSAGALPPGLTLSQTGVIGGIPAQSGSFNFTVQVSDGSGCLATRGYTLVINCPIITVSPAALPAGATGATYNQSFTASGSPGALTFSLQAGALPNGLSLSAAGALSGTPAQSGTFNFTVKATYASGCMGAQAVTLAVNCPTITVNPPTLPDKVVGQVVTTLSVNATGGVAPYAFAVTSGALPTGLTLAPNGSITGTVTAQPGPFSFTITVTDANGCQGARFYSITVNPAACPTITVAPPTISSATAGTAYSQAFTPGGGAGPYTFSSTGALPPGFTLSSGGVLGGTPSAPGSFNFVATATDANRCQGSTAYTLTVGCPAITLSSLPGGTAGTAYGQTLTASPSGGGYSFAVVSGSLPTGSTLGNGGALTGTPTTAGTFNFTVTASGFGGCTGSQAYAVVIACPTVTLAPAPLPNATVNTPYSQTVSASPSGTTYSFSVTTGALPNGLTLSPAGQLSGTPAQTGNFNFRVTATGAGSCSGFRDYQMLVSCSTISFSPASLPAGNAGVAYAQTLTITPSGSYTFSLVAGNLPSGLTLNPTTGVISGLATVTGGYNFSVRALTANGCSGTQAYTLAINCPTVTPGPASLPNGATGAAYSQSLSATPAGGNYSFAVTSGEPPTGLSLNPATGMLSGTPTANGGYSFTIRATGFGACQGSQSYSITIGKGACPTITLPELPNGSSGQIYSQSVAATPSGSYTYAQSGTLPPGVTFYNAAALLNGYPTQAGTYSFTITATDSNNCTASKNYSLAISGAGQGKTAAGKAVSGDFDGDGKTDFALWRGQTGEWLIAGGDNNGESRLQWGSALAPYFDVIVPGDYDGDGKTDVAIFRRGNGYWAIKQSSDGAIIEKHWGLGTDVPVPADYDGDGKTDIAVWRGSESNWYIVRSSDGQVQVEFWGAAYAPYNDVPVPADYDGDGKADVAVFRRANGYWCIRQSSDGQVVEKPWGLGTDVPVAADYDGDGKADIAVWRGSDTNWHIVRSSDGKVQTVSWGTASLGDVPAPADYDGDGRADVAIWRASEGAWHIRCSRDQSVIVKAQGQPGDTPVAAKSR